MQDINLGMFKIWSFSFLLGIPHNPPLEPPTHPTATRFLALGARNAIQGYNLIR